MGGYCCIVDGIFFLGMVLCDFRRMCVSQMTVLVIQFCAHPHEDSWVPAIYDIYVYNISCM